jgi:hypothetical protein
MSAPILDLYLCGPNVNISRGINAMGPDRGTHVNQ